MAKSAKSKNKTFSQAHAEWLNSHAKVWAAYSELKDPSDRLSNKEYAAYERALKARATTNYEIEQKIEMAISHICKDFVPTYVLELMHAVIEDISAMRN